MPSPDTALLVLTIDLDAVTSNWHFLNDSVKGKSKCAAVVKANAYGLGVQHVAPALFRAGCKTFFVATLDEGIVLRSVAPTVEIFVLSGPVSGASHDFVEANLIPVLNSVEQAELWQGHTRIVGRRLPAALHVDTGMNRLGFAVHDLSRPSLLDGITPLLGMTHLACAEEKDNPINKRQLERFKQAFGSLKIPRLSLAASSGIFLGPNYHFDLVRPGAALYGVNPVPHTPNPLRQTVRLQARLLQIRDVDTPMTVGYGATHSVKTKGRIATASAGYADGYFRSLGGHGFGVINGVNVPAVGRVSMDLITFDISALPIDAVKPGDMIDLIGPGNDIDALAAQAGTIGYEILTQLSHRAVRTYVGGA
jgi:alanine racemase